MLFSQRNKYKSIRESIQTDSMDDALRNALWNLLIVCVFNNYSGAHNYLRTCNLYSLFKNYWHSYFKRTIDELPTRYTDAYDTVREYFLKCKWFEVFDFIEFTFSVIEKQWQPKYEQFCNECLERELSAYRLIGGQILQITEEEEIKSIEDAIKNTEKFDGVRIHLRSSISMLANRETPDYRNSIKESISAVESLSQEITNDNKATLGSTLKILEKNGTIHPALKNSLTALYGYTSDADGIRHAMLDEPKLTFNDAKFMLVSCTAFINYLIDKKTKS